MTREEALHTAMTWAEVSLKEFNIKSKKLDDRHLARLSLLLVGNITELDLVFEAFTFLLQQGGAKYYSKLVAKEYSDEVSCLFKTVLELLRTFETQKCKD